MRWAAWATRCSTSIRRLRKSKAEKGGRGCPRRGAAVERDAFSGVGAGAAKTESKPARRRAVCAPHSAAGERCAAETFLPFPERRVFAARIKGSRLFSSLLWLTFPPVEIYNKYVCPSRQSGEGQPKPTIPGPSGPVHTILLKRYLRLWHNLVPAKAAKRIPPPAAGPHPPVGLPPAARARPPAAPSAGSRTAP